MTYVYMLYIGKWPETTVTVGAYSSLEIALRAADARGFTGGTWEGGPDRWTCGDLDSLSNSPIATVQRYELDPGRENS